MRMCGGCWVCMCSDMIMTLKTPIRYIFFAINIGFPLFIRLGATTKIERRTKNE